MQRPFCLGISTLLVWQSLILVQAREPVLARHAMVVTVEPHATDVGLSILKNGGNAIDAAVAVGFALAVTHPSAGNIGGGGFMVIRLAEGRSTFIDFRERAPATASPTMYLDSNGHPTRDSDMGYRASGVPGTVRGLELAQRKYGRSTWPELLQPALQLASKGFVVSVGLARQLKASQNRLGAFPDSRRIFLRDGRPYKPGEILKQPELSVTLRRLMKQGANDFYEGDIAHLIAADMQAHGGLVSFDDLKNYRPIERSLLVGSYRGYTILTAPPPSSGGIGILQMLAMLEPSGFEKTGAGSPVAIHYMTEAMRRFFADRSRYLGDPDFSPVPVSSLLDPKYIAMRRKSIDPAHATPGDEISPGTLIATIHESSQTTHYSIVDPDGNAVAVTYTLNGNFGSGVTAKGTGILLNNEMDDFSAKPGSPNTGQMSYQGAANAVQPNKTPLSSMSPTIVLRDGGLFAVLGSPGGPTIINTVLEVLVNLIDFHMNIAEAVDAPRFHHQWTPDLLQVEPGFSPDTIERLKSFGHKIEQISRQGEVAAIVSQGGSLQGAADPRTEGKAAGY